ncbi:MAG: Uncharacterised protein [Owenweeksia sp. TMED14]|nr:MAG: Uncharacterised protein [Owenweeksia sp. TMED14]
MMNSIHTCKQVFRIIFLTIITSCVQTHQPDLKSINLQRGELLLCGDGEFGDVDFSLTCDYSVRDAFDIAVSLLHSFEYDDAERAFVKVIDVDPDCAMAYWGVAMSIYHSLWSAPASQEMEKGSLILELAKKITKTEKEKDYINAIGGYFEDWEKIEHKTRAVIMEKRMEKLYKKYKDDSEAAIFYALSLKSTSDPGDKTRHNERKAGRILESIFPDKPNHPGIAHYIIHNYDNPELASMALTTARRYSNIAPASAHAQHMPSHIFTRLGLWEESIVSNIRSADAAQCYAEASGKDGHWASEIHALDYLLYAYLQIGDNKKAIETHDYLKNIKSVWGGNSAYPFAAYASRLALENKNWELAAKIEIPEIIKEWEIYPWEKSIIHFSKGLGGAQIGDLQLAKSELIEIKGLYKQLLDQKEIYKAKQVLIQVKSLGAWLEFAKGNYSNAKLMMQESATIEDGTEKHPITPGEIIPANELLGDLLIAIGEPENALIAYKKSLKRSPNRFNGIYGAARASALNGNHEMAANYYRILLQFAGNSSQRPEIFEALSYVNKL